MQRRRDRDDKVRTYDDGFRVVAEVKENDIAAKKHVPNKETTKARRCALYTRLVRNLEPPIVVRNFKDGAGDVELKVLFDRWGVGFLDHAFPLAIGRSLEQP